MQFRIEGIKKDQAVFLKNSSKQLGVTGTERLATPIGLANRIGDLGISE